jgi:hypothetical protein
LLINPKAEQKRKEKELKSLEVQTNKVETIIIKQDKETAHKDRVDRTVLRGKEAKQLAETVLVTTRVDKTVLKVRVDKPLVETVSETTQVIALQDKVLQETVLRDKVDKAETVLGITDLVREQCLLS